MYHFPYHDRAAWLVAHAWRTNLLDGKDAKPRPIEEGIPPAVLAARVADLAPEMTIMEREQFIIGFADAWSRIDLPDETPDQAGCSQGEPPYEEIILKAWLSVIATRRKPVASALRRRISPGDTVAYPREYEAMILHPGDFGSPKFYDSRLWHPKGLNITHRQLALHVEFAPLLAAVFLASRLPGIFFGTSSNLACRPQMTTLLDVLLSRRPDNITDDQFLPCVRWLLQSRPPLWSEFDSHIIG